MGHEYDTVITPEERAEEKTPEEQLHAWCDKIHKEICTPWTNILEAPRGERSWFIAQ